MDLQSPYYFSGQEPGSLHGLYLLGERTRGAGRADTAADAGARHRRLEATGGRGESAQNSFSTSPGCSSGNVDAGREKDPPARSRIRANRGRGSYWRRAGFGGSATVADRIQDHSLRR